MNHTPGAFQSMPGAARANVVGPAIQKRCGLLRMQPGSQHAITIRPKGAAPVMIQCRARDRREVQNATVLVVCLHPTCQGKSWESFAKMASEHPTILEMQRTLDAHVWGLWSNDPVGEKVAGCDACKASKTEPCAAHHGGVIGLVAPFEARADEP